MKIRNDFVTNSSSSSFIFKEVDTRKLMDIAYEKSWDCEYEKKEALEKLSFLSCEICRLQKANREVLDLVFGWYSDNILYSIFGFKFQKDDWTEVAQISMSEKQKNRWQAYIVLYLNDYYYRFQSEETKIEIFTKEYIQNLIEYYMLEGWDDSKYVYIMDNLEELQKELILFDGMYYGEIVECVFDAKYIYFNEMEEAYYMKEIVVESGMCEFACCHMG